MKPGPAISSASTQRCDRRAGLQRGDQRGRPVRAGCVFSGLASCIAAVEARSPMRGLLGRFEGRRAAAAAGLTSAIAAPSAASRSCLAWIIEPILRGGPCTRIRPRRCGSRGCRGVNCCSCTGLSAARGPMRESPDPGCRPLPMSNIITPQLETMADARAAARADRQVPRPRPARRRRDQRSLPRPRRLPGPQRRDQARAPVALGDPVRRPLLRALLRGRGRAGRAAAAPERGADLRRGARPGRALPGDGIRARQHAAALLPRRPAAAARADRRDRLQVRDGAGLCATARA